MDNACIVGAGARLTGPVILGHGCIIGEDAVIEKSILWENIKVSPGAIIRNSIIGSNNNISSNTVLDDQIIGSDNCIVI